MYSIFKTLKFIFSHPIGRKKPFSVLTRWIRWQFGSRILGLPVIYPFFGQTRLILTHGMHGATMNLYVGFQEFYDMCFVIHLLRQGDLFIDVGANVGVYSILAGGLGAKVLAVEPVPSTFNILKDNIRLNYLENRVAAHNMGLSSKMEVLKFSFQHGPMNRVIFDSETIPGIDVHSDRLDNLLKEDRPYLIKIDVEGYEAEVINGAENILSQQTLAAVILELNGSGRRYGCKDYETDDRMRQFGFKPAHYDPFKRNLMPMQGYNKYGNTLYIRNKDSLMLRLNTAPEFNLFDISI